MSHPKTRIVCKTKKLEKHFEVTYYHKLAHIDHPKSVTILPLNYIPNQLNVNQLSFNFRTFKTQN